MRLAPWLALLALACSCGGDEQYGSCSSKQERCYGDQPQICTIDITALVNPLADNKYSWYDRGSPCSGGLTCQVDSNGVAACMLR